MRIAILTNAFPPDGRGGAERIAWLQAEGLASRGHEVRVWAPTDRQSPTTHNLQSTTCTIEVTRFRSSFHRLESMNVLSRLFFHLCADLLPRMNVVKEILDWKPDAIISHNLTGCGIGTPQRIKKRGNIPWIHILHDVQLTDPSGQILASDAVKPYARAWRAFWSFWRRRYFFGVPDVLASPTRWLLAWHENYGFKGKKNVILPNPVEIKDAGEHSCAKPATILYAGRLSRDKGFHHFLDAIQYLDEELVSGIVIIGCGPLADVIKDVRDERVEYCGWRKPEDVRTAIRNAGLLVAPSLILENQQTVILEAMAEGTPMIATDVGGTRETLEGTGCPVISPASNVPVEIANAVRRLIDDQGSCRRISIAMRERAGRHESEHYIDALEKGIIQLISV
jgi:glycosyltransferase involved in cell wall biosynthesis